MNETTQSSEQPENNSKVTEFFKGVWEDLTELKLNLFKPKNINQEYQDEKGQVQLVGQITCNRLQQEPFKTWYNEHYEAYKTNQEVIKELKPKLTDVKTKVFLGTWCGDTKRGVPQFIKLTEKLCYKYKHIDLIAVDRTKNTPNGLADGHNIEKVPTYIFYRDGQEIGRIIENPKTTLEEDMMEILS